MEGKTLGLERDSSIEVGKKGARMNTDEDRNVGGEAGSERSYCLMVSIISAR